MFHLVFFCIFFKPSFTAAQSWLFKRLIKMYFLFDDHQAGEEESNLSPPGQPGERQAANPHRSASSASSFQAGLLWSGWWRLWERSPESPCRTSPPRSYRSDRTPWNEQHLCEHNVNSLYVESVMDLSSVRPSSVRPSVQPLLWTSKIYFLIVRAQTVGVVRDIHVSAALWSKSWMNQR